MKARARKKRVDGGGERRLALVLLVLSGALFLFTGVVEGPKVARQVWSNVGVKRVEAHAGVLCAAAAESGLDPSLLAGVMYVESRGNVGAVSNKGAMGLFQLMPPTAAEAAKRLRIAPPTSEQLLSDPLLNARLAASHLSWLYRYEGPDLERVLVAYNAGSGTLRKMIKSEGGWSRWREIHAEKQDSPTLTYAQEVLDFADRFRRRGVVVGGTAKAAAESGM
jgi:hypothetical protein